MLVALVIGGDGGQAERRSAMTALRWRNFADSALTCTQPSRLLMRTTKAKPGQPVKTRYAYVQLAEAAKQCCTGEPCGGQRVAHLKRQHALLCDCAPPCGHKHAQLCRRPLPIGVLGFESLERALAAASAMLWARTHRRWHTCSSKHIVQALPRMIGMRW